MLQELGVGISLIRAVRGCETHPPPRIVTYLVNCQNPDDNFNTLLVCSMVKKVKNNFHRYTQPSDPHTFRSIFTLPTERQELGMQSLPPIFWVGDSYTPERPIKVEEKGQDKGDVATVPSPPSVPLGSIYTSHFYCSMWRDHNKETEKGTPSK